MTLIDQICRLEVENAILKVKVQQLEHAGDRIVKLVNEIYGMMGGPSILQEAVKEWEIAKGEGK